MDKDRTISAQVACDGQCIVYEGLSFTLTLKHSDYFLQNPEYIKFVKRRCCEKKIIFDENTVSSITIFITEEERKMLISEDSEIYYLACKLIAEKYKDEILNEMPIFEFNGIK